MKGRAILIRYADDFVVAFQYRTEAQEFYRELPQRLKKFNLEVAPEKTHIKRFSRFLPSRVQSFEFCWGIDRKDEPRLNKEA